MSAKSQGSRGMSLRSLNLNPIKLSQPGRLAGVFQPPQRMESCGGAARSNPSPQRGSNLDKNGLVYHSIRFIGVHVFTP